MDEILLLLMHAQRGLKIHEDEMIAILKGDPETPAAYVSSERAKLYLAAHSDWRAESLAVLEESEKHGVRWSRFGKADYPRGWLTLSNKPYVFSYLGTPCWKNRPLFAVVGSRSPMGDSRLWMQRELSCFLRGTAVGVVSGGARGIDQWAHRLSIDESQPTVCVLPSGILNPYPHGNQELWRRIVGTGGSLLSTFQLKDPMRKQNFHVRNRWIVGFSPVVFVVEANRRSGSALTAALAREEGRTICTLPVFPHSDQGLGNLDLLADGAQLVRDHADLAALWGSFSLSPAFLE